MTLFENINLLPNDIIEIIHKYIPTSVIIFLDKNTYIDNHHLIRQYINKSNIENYMRSMVRQDNYFVFEMLLFENCVKWLNMKQYYYKECIYCNYLKFLESYSIDNQSLNCRKILVKFFNDIGFNKHKNKKKTLRYTRWRE